MILIAIGLTILGAVIAIAAIDYSSRTRADWIDEAICQLYRDGKIDLAEAERLFDQHVRGGP